MDTEKKMPRKTIKYYPKERKKEELEYSLKRKKNK